MKIFHFNIKYWCRAKKSLWTPPLPRKGFATLWALFGPFQDLLAWFWSAQVLQRCRPAAAAAGIMLSNGAAMATGREGGVWAESKYSSKGEESDEKPKQKIQTGDVTRNLQRKSKDAAQQIKPFRALHHGNAHIAGWLHLSGDYRPAWRWRGQRRAEPVTWRRSLVEGC